MAEVKHTESVTVRLPSEVIAKLDLIAQATERSRSYVILRALKGYLLQEGADIVAAIEGRSQLDAGEHEDFDAVLAEMDRIIAGKVA